MHESPIISLSAAQDDNWLNTENKSSTGSCFFKATGLTAREKGRHFSDIPCFVTDARHSSSFVKSGVSKSALLQHRNLMTGSIWWSGRSWHHTSHYAIWQTAAIVVGDFLVLLLELNCQTQVSHVLSQFLNTDNVISKFRDTENNERPAFVSDWRRKVPMD